MKDGDVLAEMGQEGVVNVDHGPAPRFQFRFGIGPGRAGGLDNDSAEEAVEIAPSFDGQRVAEIAKMEGALLVSGEAIEDFLPRCHGGVGVLSGERPV